MDNLVAALCGIELEPDRARALEAELCGLADKLPSGRRCLVHHDLQSQNVMIYREEPFLIDFQGMRFGSHFYDLGSLLCDPYVSFTDAERMELLYFYYGLSHAEPAWADFAEAFWQASAQRLMQALGAYGCLGDQKGTAELSRARSCRPPQSPDGRGKRARASAAAGSLQRMPEQARLHCNRIHVCPGFRGRFKTQR